MIVPVLSIRDDQSRPFHRVSRVKGTYLYWVILHAELIVNVALTALAIGGILELWEWIAMGRR